MNWWAYLLAFCAVLGSLGYGLGLARLLGIGVNLGDAGILGLLCIAALGCLIHFEWALSPAVQCIVIGAGLALCLAFHSELWRQAKQNLASVFVGLTAFFHNHAQLSYDNGLYHIQTFMWNSQFPITVGLGNLHARLAFNSGLFLIAPLDDRLAFGWITNLVVLIFILMSCFARFSQVRSDSVEAWFLTLAVVVLAFLPDKLSWLGVLNADGVAAMLVVYWLCIWLSLGGAARTDVALLLLTSVLAFAVKISTAPLLVFAILIGWFYRKAAGAALWKSSLVAGGILGLWMARGLMLSGCAIYPIAQSCVAGLPWAVPISQVKFDYVGIRSWARAIGRLDYAAVMADWKWVQPWLARYWQNLSGILFVVGSIFGCMGVVIRAQASRAVMAALAGIWICLAYWFISAPDIRFGSGYLVAAGILGLSFACVAQFEKADVALRLTLEGAAVAILMGAIGLAKTGNTWQLKDRPSFVSVAAPGGKLIAIPQKSDQCWDHSLPCTPYYDPEAVKRIRWR